MYEHINLHFLEEISAGDRQKLRKLLTTFMQEAPKAFELISKSFSEKKFEELGHAAHTVKPLYLSIGSDKAGAIIKNLEDYSRSAIYRELIPVEILELEKINQAIFNEMNAFLNINLND